MSNIEEIENNWKQFESIISRFDSNNIKTMIEENAERLAVAPANARNTDSNAVAGGLIKDTMEILKAARMIDAATGKLCDPRTLYKIVVLHNLGSLGTVEKDLFLPQDSDWHLEKLGMVYKINPSLVGLDRTDLTFQFLANYGVSLNEEEYNAILALRTKEPNNHYGKVLLAARILNK